MTEPATIEIEPDGQSDAGACPDCGNPTRTVWGFVYADGVPHAVYFARWTPGHVERGAQMLVSVGGWGDSEEDTGKRAVGLECRITDGRPTFTVVDAATLPWAGDPLLGRMLSRLEALADGSGKRGLAIAVALVAQDPRIGGFFGTD